nr:MAG TPA: hypothetical protein [Caudoviricetes sp.]
MWRLQLQLSPRPGLCDRGIIMDINALMAELAQYIVEVAIAAFAPSGAM